MQSLRVNYNHKGYLAISVMLRDAKPATQGEMRGTTWTVRNAGGDGLRQGQRCAVEKVDGLVLSVRAQGE